MGDLFADIAARSVRKTQKAMKAKKYSPDVVNSLRLLEDQAHLATIHSIPVNCFPMEYVLGTSGMPLNRFMTIQGPNKSSKSSMFWFMARHFLASGGYVMYFDLETKYDEPTAQAYVGNPIAFSNRVKVFKPGSVEAFNQLLARLLMEIHRQKSKMGMRPLLIGIDTLGTSTSARQLKSTLSGVADPGFNPAKSTAITQSALQNAMAFYLDRLPMMMVAIQQERVAMGDDKEIYPTGGKYSGYAKSVTWRMWPQGCWQQLDKRLPVLRVEQQKVANNVERSIRLTLPTGFRKNRIGLKEYWFQWDYAMMQLLTDIPATMLAGICNVKRPSEKTFAVTSTTRTEAKKSVFEKTYGGASGSYSDIGGSMLADLGLLAALRVAMDINVYRPYNARYTVPTSLFGDMWLGPEECPEWESLDKEGILDFHSAWIEERKAAKKQEADQTEEEERAAVAAVLAEGAEGADDDDEDEEE